MDTTALHHYLTLRFIPAPYTMLRGIHKLPPAHVLIYQDEEVTISRYWALSFLDKLAVSEDEYLEGLADKLRRTVKAHLLSDVPVGAFLSGGLDSSMVVALMAGEMDKPFKSFSIGVAAADFNELPYARLVAQRFGTQHHEECVEPDNVQLWPQIVWHLDEPSDPIAWCQFQAARLAARHVKVALGGDGGDELFAGFDRYLAIGYVDTYALLPGAVRRKLLGPLIERLSDSFTYKSLTQRIRWLHQLSLLSSGDRYAATTSFSRFDHGDKEALFGAELWREVSQLDSAAIITGHFDAAPANNVLDQMLYADYMTRLPEHSLMLVDRMAMAHGLEARSPFVDHELVEYMARFPANQKIRGRQLKYVLRRMAAGYLPPAIVARGKQGFMLPVAYWFRDELFPLLHALLLDSHFVRAGLFRIEAVERLLEEHRGGRVDHHVRLAMLLNLVMWHEIYIERESPADLGARMALMASKSGAARTLA
jgi:asparagine synthase (glutamine-hydrolysing)